MTVRIGRFLVLSLAVGWFVALRPTILGGPATYLLVGGQSMEPTIRSGSLVVAFAEDHYGVGDVVVYRIPEGEVAAGRQVIHRIVGGSGETGFLMRGDNTNGNDVWHPTTSAVLGKARFVVPGLAWAISLLRSPIVLAALASGLAAYAVLSVIPVRRGGPPDSELQPTATT